MTRAEDIGRAVYERCGLDPAVLVRGGAAALARMRGVGVRKSPLATTEASLGRLGDQPLISVHAKIAPHRANFAVATMLARHEIGHIDPIETAVAAYLVAPNESFDNVANDTNGSASALSGVFVITQTCATLRMVERGLCDAVIVTPSAVRRPGSMLSWVSDDEVRRIAKGSPRSVRKVRITDEPGRVALLR